jgi:hypothetical protein
MECPHQISFSEIFTQQIEEQNISQIADFQEEVSLNLYKKESFEEFLGMEDESTEISILLTSLDSSSNVTINTLNRPFLKEEETESVGEILAILKKCPMSCRHGPTPSLRYINPFGSNNNDMKVIKPVAAKKTISLSGKVLSSDNVNNLPERVSRPVPLKSSLFTLQK